MCAHLTSELKILEIKYDKKGNKTDKSTTVVAYLNTL